MNTFYKLGDCEGFRLNPCVCGCGRVAFFRKGETTYIKCVMCLMTATGSTEAEAERNWDEMTKKKEEVKKVATRRKRTDSGKTTSSR